MKADNINLPQEFIAGILIKKNYPTRGATTNCVFVRKIYCNHEFFLLNINEDKCIYIKSIDNEYIIISLYVDDMHMLGTSINVNCNERQWYNITREHYVEKFMKKFNHYRVIPISPSYDVNS